jgi:hypothetical protein
VLQIERGPSLGLEPRKCISIPGARPGRGVIHPASLSEAGRNDPFLSASKPLPPHSSSGLDRLRNAPGSDNAIPGPFIDVVHARRLLCLLYHLRVSFVGTTKPNLFFTFRFGA